MHSLIQEVQKAQLKKVPEVRTGYTVRVHQKIKEGSKERVQVFEGLVIKVGHGEGVEKTITVRKIVEGIGVEKIFPVNSPNITKIEVKKKAKVRRAKLYYMRERSGKSARLQERHVTEAERVAEEAKMEAMVQEAVNAEEKRKKEEAAKAAEAGEGEEIADETESTPEPEPSSAEVTESEPAEPAAESTKAGEGVEASEGAEAKAPAAEEVPEEEPEAPVAEEVEKEAEPGDKEGEEEEKEKSQE